MKELQFISHNVMHIHAHVTSEVMPTCALLLLEDEIILIHVHVLCVAIYDELTYSLVNTIPEHALYGFIVLQHNSFENVVQAGLQERREIQILDYLYCFFLKHMRDYISYKIT
jgi:hypothetical protein